MIDRECEKAKPYPLVKIPMRKTLTMQKTIAKMCSFFLFAAMLALPTFAAAAPIQPVAPPARQSLIPTAAEIGQQIQNLVTGGEGEVEPQETFGTRALGLILTSADVVQREAVAFVTNFGAVPEVTAWFHQQLSNPALRDRWIQIALQLLLVVGGALVSATLADLVLLPARRQITQRQGETFWERFVGLLSWFCVALLPVILFVGAALMLLEGSDSPRLVRLVVMTVVYALALLRLVRLFVKFLLAPKAAGLRLLPITTPQALYLQHWLSAFSFVMVLGYFIADVARLVKVPEGGVTAFSSIVGLIVVVMTIIVIVQKRAYVSAQLRGDLPTTQRGLTLGQSLRVGLARTWHVLAIGYLVIGYTVTMLGAKGGFALMQRGTILTLLILFALRIASYVVAHLWPAPHEEGKVTAGIFRPVFKGLLRLSAWSAAVAGIAAAWGVDVGGLLSSAWGQRIMGSVFSIVSTIAIVVLIYEAIHASIERKLNRVDAYGNVIVNGRTRALLPMVRSAAMILMIIIVGMITLSELGVNIAPLLAGAGVIGVAIGFGSQALVKDFLTGLFIILEDTISIGDTVTLGDHTGDVEGMSIRTIRLRDKFGALHILPFGEITRIVNQSKGFSYALMDISVAYDSDLKHVIEVMKEVGKDVAEDPALKDLILEPIEVFGVEKLGDSAITITCRIKTAPGKHLPVKRAYLLRVKERFDAEHIEIPFPTVMQVQRGGA